MQQATETAKPAKPNLFHIVESMLSALDQIEENEGEITPELGERLDRLEPQIEERGEAIAAVCQTLEQEAEACDRFAAIYSGRARRKVRQAKALKARLHDAMNAMGRTKIKTATVTIGIQASAPALVLDVETDEVPDQWVEVVATRKVRTADLKKALKADPKAVEFAHLDTRTHIRFR